MSSQVYPLANLPGMTAVYARQLSDLGLTNTQQLYRYGQSPQHRQTLATTLKATGTVHYQMGRVVVPGPYPRRRVRLQWAATARWH